MELPACSQVCSSAAPGEPCFYPLPLQRTWAAFAAIGTARYTMFMSIGRALFVAWCTWIGTLVVGSAVLLLLDKPEWRVAVGMLSLLIGFLAFIFSRRI